MYKRQRRRGHRRRPGRTPSPTSGARATGRTIRYGDFLNAVISFLLVAAAVYFVVVLPVSKLMARFRTEPEPVEATQDCPECRSKISQQVRRCAFCTAPLAPAA